MSGSKKLVEFCNRNVVFLVGIPLIVSFHWAWNVLQKNPQLVRPDERRELPIITGVKYLEHKVVGGGTEQK